MNYKIIPKVELHVHLDGSIPPHILAKLANICEEEAIKKAVAPSKCLDLNDYLTRFSLPISVMNSKENLCLIASLVAQDMKEENVIYAEIRFAPMQHTSTTLSLDEIVEATLEGLHKIDIKTNLLLSMMRNHSLEVNKKVIDLAYKYLNKGICGVDLAGAEALYPTRDFESLFEYAKKLNVPFTIHAGEADGTDSIKSAINFGAKRIGHGVRSIEDETLINELIEKDILLEICPTSNIQTNVTKNYQEHPFYYLYKKGVKVSINTDNRTVSNVTLTDEYQKLAETFNLTEEDFYQINKNSIKSAFISEQEKEELYKRLEYK